ncbi:helix-turn-helix transcriptional regulator [Methylomonas sp. BW4-1]|uniref:helix-turn-helix transcriptional regulator n=1 Tax=Methylomonas sp. BW4-1 TaxID=3376685 RepID=UPI0040423EB1
MADPANKTNQESFYRIDQIVGNPKKTPPVPAIIPIGKRTFLKKVADGKIAKPVKFGRCSLWRKSDIDRLVSEISGEVAV